MLEMGTENGEELANAVGMGRKYPDDPKTEIFEAAASGNAVLLNEVLQQMNSSERASALETKMATRLADRFVYDEYKIFKVTPLILAAKNGNLDCVKVLLDYKADIEGQGGNDEDDIWGGLDYLQFRYSCRGYTPLFVAAIYGNFDVLSCLVENGADVNARTCTYGNHTPLMIASAYGNNSVVTLLSEHGADMDLRDNTGKTALHYAVDSHDVLSCLIKNGGDVNECTYRNHSPLMIASAYGNDSVVTLLSEHGADMDLRDNTGKTALHYAVDSHDVLSCLIKNGADVNARTDDNRTPLMIASKNGDVNVVTFLIEHGANVELQDKDGKTALHHAIHLDQSNDSCDVLSCLIKNGADVNARTNDNCTPLMIASKNGDVNEVTFLIEHGANVELQDKDGKTALHHAIHLDQGNDSCDVLSCLIKNGADVNACTNDKCTPSPLMIAIKYGHENVVTFLIEHGANVELQDKDGRTALHHAIDLYEGNVSRNVLSCLIKNGADVNACTNEDCTPLMIASADGHVNVVTFLIKHGANVELQDKDGLTALHHAIPCFNHSSCNVLSCLIKNGADVNACTNNKCTPLMIASGCTYLHENVVTFLVKHGANMDQQDKNGDTALHYTVNTIYDFYCDSSKFAHKLLTLGASQLYNNQRLTPLLLASINRATSVMEYLFTRPECTKEQRIDALELLGASLATCSSYVYERDTEGGFEYMKRGMKERFADPSRPLLKQSMEPVEAYQNRKESQTLEELAWIEGDINAIIMEGFIIKERILGIDKTDLLVSIRNVASHYKNSKDKVHLSIGLYKYAMKIAKSCNQSAISDLYSLVYVLAVYWNVPLKQKDLLELLEQIVLEYEKQQLELRKGLESELDEDSKLSREHLFDCSLFLVQAIAKFKHCEEGKITPVSVLLRKLCQINPQYCDGFTLLHRAVVKDHMTDALPCTDTLKLLLNAGMDVNVVNHNGDTPLHVAVNIKPGNDNIHLLTDVLEVLLDGGAHHDFVNNDGKTAMDIAQTSEACKVLSEKRKLELKCISASAVKKFGLPYLGVVPKTLEKYISMH